MADDWTAAITEAESGSVLALSVNPGAKLDLFPAGYNPWRSTILCQVRAAAVEGKANQAVISLVAATLAMPRTAITVLSGHRSSKKLVLVQGLHRQVLIERLSPFFSRAEP